MTLIELRDAIDKALAARPDMGRMQVATAEYHSPADEKPTLLGALYGIHADTDSAVITHRSNPWPTRHPTPSDEVIVPIPADLAQQILQILADSTDQPWTDQLRDLIHGDPEDTTPRPTQNGDNQ